MNSWSHEQQCVPQVRMLSNYIYKLSTLVSEVQNLVEITLKTGAYSCSVGRLKPVFSGQPANFLWVTALYRFDFNSF